MKNPLDENRGAAVLEELVRRLKTRDNIGQMLCDLGEQTPDNLAAELADELEKIIKWRHLQHELLTRTQPASPVAVPSSEPVAAPVLPIPQPSMPVRKPVKEVPPKVEDRVEQVKIQTPPLQAAEKEEDIHSESEQSARKQVPRIPSDLGDESCIYLHGVSKIDPNDTPSPVPFLLEEKGIDSRNFAFALDYQGLRFYGSPLYRESVNLTKNGVLLLNKQEGIRMRGAHEGLLNDLRLHGILLPFEFGTVFSGKDEFESNISLHFTEIRESLDELLTTRWWNLSVYALDSRTAELVGQSTPGGRRESDRGRIPYSSPVQPKRIDVKTLERILNKQKKAAESIHEALHPYAERSDIDMMVSLQSGSSDDWKIILKVSYELGPSMLNQFVRTVTDLQYQHFLMELMLSLAGNVEHFSFAKS